MYHGNPRAKFLGLIAYNPYFSGLKPSLVIVFWGPKVGSIKPKYHLKWMTSFNIHLWLMSTFRISPINNMPKHQVMREFLWPFLGWLSDCFQMLSDLQLLEWDKKVTLNHLGWIFAQGLLFGVQRCLPADFSDVSFIVSQIRAVFI